MEFQLRIGALSPPITDQLDEQGIPYDAEEAARWEQWAAAIVGMSIHGIVTSSERQRINKRLCKRIEAQLEQHARTLRVEASNAPTAGQSS